MKKVLIGCGVIGGVVLLIVLMFVMKAYGMYNNFVALDEAASSQWGQVQNVYDRRLQLIPNLVATVKGYASHEKDVLENVAAARSRVGQVNMQNLANDPNAQEAYIQAQGQLSSALSRLIAVSENYPNLKANENFLSLQSQLEGTENRITVERRKYQEAVQAYNTAIRRFPGSVVAGFTGFHARAYFAADERAASAPVVKF